MSTHSLAGKSPPKFLLVNVPRLVTAYYMKHPDVKNLAERVSFGTSGHRGSSFKSSFNEDHVLAIIQAICDYRRANAIKGSLFLGMDTHALSEPSHVTAIEVLAANAVECMIHKDLGYTPTPVISHAILADNRGRKSGLGDGIIITPSHTPPEDGGLKYNPPHGGPADTNVTQWVEDHEVQDVRAAEAVALFCYQARRWIGAFAAALNGPDTVVFARREGARSPARICDGLKFLGIELEEKQNAVNAGVISTNGSSVTVRVIHTDEE